MTGSCAPAWVLRHPRHLLSAILLLVAVSAPAAAAGPISVPLDQAVIISLPDRAATIIIGNPLIADVSLIRTKNRLMANVIAKGYGATNVIVMDADGVELLKTDVEVTVPTDSVVVYRNTDRETYSCTPDCSRRLTLGDAPDFFDKTMTQITTRNTQAAAAGALAGGR
jgi:Flp pilus assembly secretin CpaC